MDVALDDETDVGPEEELSAARHGRSRGGLHHVSLPQAAAGCDCLPTSTPL
jgi:hypothetical protein